MLIRPRGSWVPAAALLLLSAGPGAAATAKSPTPLDPPLDTGLLSPLSVAVAADGGVWYAENYAGLLHHRTAAGRVTTPVKAPGDLEIGAVSGLDGTVWYAVSGDGHKVGRLHELDPDGSGQLRDTVVTDLYAHERQANPDHRFSYGFRDLPPVRRPAAERRGGRRTEAGRRLIRSPRCRPTAPSMSPTPPPTRSPRSGQDTDHGRVIPPVRTTMTRGYAGGTTAGMHRRPRLLAEAVPRTWRRGRTGRST